MSELERQLTQLGRELDWPATPELARSVTERLTPAPARRRRPIVFRRSLAIALAALLVLAGGVVAAVPATRHAVLEFFGLRGATVERREQLPPLPAKRGPLGLGEPTTLSAARGSLSFAPLVPAAAGEPDGVYVHRAVPGGQVTLTYRARSGLPEARTTGLGLLVDEFRGDLLPEYAGKIAGQATRIEPLRVDGESAIWLEGAPHFFFYRPPNASFREDRLRLAQNVLLIQHGRLLVRLEGAFAKERAIELARSLR